jgi:hypothetical protein
MWPAWLDDCPTDLLVNGDDSVISFQTVWLPPIIPNIPTELIQKQWEEALSRFLEFVRWKEQCPLMRDFYPQKIEVGEYEYVL